MTPVLLVVLALGTAQAEATPIPEPPAPQAAPAPDRTGRALLEAVQETLRRWARPSDQDAPTAAAELLKLYAEIDRDDELSINQRDNLRTKVRSRLMELAQQIAKRAAIERRLARGGPADVDLPENAVLAQMRGAGGFGGGFGPGGFGGGFGPGGVAGGFGLGGNMLADDDHGQALVDLIQKTISPASWDINGGRGSIYYWRPGRAIVVRATDEVHGQLGDVLRQIERAGR